MVSSAFSKRSLHLLHSVRHYAIAVFVVVAVSATTPVALAQSSNQQLQHQIQLLRRELADLQKAVFKGEAPASVAPSATGDGSGSVPSSIAGRLQVKMQRLEEQLRDLNGNYEQMDNRIRRMETRLDKLVEDVDFRLRALEDGQPVANAGQQSKKPDQASGNATDAQDLNATDTTIISSQGAQGPAAPQQPGTLGTLTKDDLKAAQSGRDSTSGSQTQTASVPTSAPAPADTPKAQYDQAMSLLHQRNFDAAESSLRTFLDRYPDDNLAGNAKYWLGETYYARKNYAEAARIFSDAYMKDKQGTKATHSLLKLAMSLEQVGQTEASCVAYLELISKHGDAEPRILDRAKAARQKLNCQ